MEKSKFNSLIDILREFSTEKLCREYLEKSRWEDGKIVCFHCGYNEKIYKINDGKLYKCAKCRKQFTVRMGTIFEDSPLPLQKWFISLYLVISNKKGISSLQLSRDIEVTQATAWFILHRLRYAISSESFNKPLEGIVEADETYWGGKEKNKHSNKRIRNAQGRSTDNKTPIFGMLQRDGRLITQMVLDTSSTTLQPIINANVKEGSILSTDEWKAYNGLSERYDHLVVKHKEKQYVDGIAHTNNLEGFWSLLKRGLHGTYHSISPKYLDRYCGEFTYRYNTRKENNSERFNNSLSLLKGRLKYKDLIN